MQTSSSSFYKYLAISLWAFSCGIPLLLISVILSTRLAELHLPLQYISLFSLALIPYGLKFFFSGFVERFSISLLKAFCDRAQSWMIIGMTGVIIGLCGMGLIEIKHSKDFYLLFLFTLFTALSSAITDIAEGELRIGWLNPSELATGSFCYSIGYGTGELTAGGFSLFIAYFFNWKMAYLLASVLMLMGIITLSLLPKKIFHKVYFPKESIFQILKKSIFSLKRRKNFILLLIIIIFYYYSADTTLMLLNPLFLSLGFTKIQFAKILFGPCLIVILAGGILGIICCKKIGIISTLILAGCGYIIQDLLLIILTNSTAIPVLQISLSTHNFSIISAIMLLGYFLDSMSIVAYITFSSSYCQKPYIASQYALLTSIKVWAEVIFSCSGGFLLKYLGWRNLFWSCITVTFIVLMILLQSQKNNIRKMHA